VPELFEKFYLTVFLPALFAVLFGLTPPVTGQSEYDVVAGNFLKYLNSDKKVISTQLIEANRLTPTLSKVPIAYLASLEDGGYILISASKSLTPIKAYSLVSDFETLPEAYKEFLFSEMEYNIRALTSKSRTTQGTASGEAKERWDFLLTFGTRRTTLSYTPDTHLLTTRWNQGIPFNKFLPEIDGQKVLAGCVNVAMAQIMTYHRYPQRGNGVAVYDWNDQQLKAVLFRPYHWENMPDILDGIQAEYMEDEVALLIRDIGVVNHTAFGLDNSGAAINSNALIENFGYSNTLASMDNQDTTSFFETLKTEIDAERPVLLSFPGHMTVADGYSSDQTGRKVHVNMGWGGHYDDYYFLDDTVQAGDHIFDPAQGLTIYYNIKPCSGPDCSLNLESEDSITGLEIGGKFDYEKDADRYDVYLKGETTIAGNMGYQNQAFYVSIYDSRHSMLVSSADPISKNLPPGRYTIRLSLYGEAGGFYLYDDEHTEYTVSIATENMTDAEKEAIDASLDVAPVISSSLRDILLNSSNTEPHKILIDARDENGDPLDIAVINTNRDAVETALAENILTLTPVADAEGAASRVIVTAAANNKSTEKAFVVMVSDEDIGFGKEFVLQGVFENQDDFNTHKVILDGQCTITGYNGYSNQAFYSSVMHTDENFIVLPADSDINYTFTTLTYLLGASLKQNPGGTGSYYPYESGVNDRYRLTICCPDADDSTESIAGILDIDLTGTSIQQYTLNVSKSGPGHGDVVSFPAGINCGSCCSGLFYQGTQVVIVATPDAGCVFSGWSGCECSGTDTCSVTMDAEKNVVATFSLLGDVHEDGIINLADAILTLQIGCRATSGDVNKEADIDGDQRIGLAETIYIMQELAGW